MSTLRALAARWARTAFHPQWLLGSRRIPENIDQVSVVILDIGAAGQWLVQHLSINARYVSLDCPSTGRDLYGARPHVFADLAINISAFVTSLLWPDWSHLAMGYELEVRKP